MTLDEAIEYTKEQAHDKLAIWLEELVASRLIVDHVATDGAMITPELVEEANRISSNRKD